MSALCHFVGRTVAQQTLRQREPRKQLAGERVVRACSVELVTGRLTGNPEAQIDAGRCTGVQPTATEQAVERPGAVIAQADSGARSLHQGNTAMPALPCRTWPGHADRLPAPVRKRMQLPIQAEDTAAQSAADRHRLQAKAHVQLAAIVEKRVADGFSLLELQHDFGADQVTLIRTGVQRIEVVFEKYRKVLVLEALELALRAKEGFKILE
ncbi:hypothetical protein D3C80_1492820 [compost metagenome]